MFASPVEAHIANIKDFLIERMEIPGGVVRDMEISKIRQIHPKNLPQHRRTTGLPSSARPPRKAMFSLRDSYERDLVLSYARNLKEGCNLGIVVPEFLLPLKSKLEGLSYKIRQHTNKTGNKVSTSLRLEDKSMSLVMAVRDKKTDPLLHYSLTELKQLESSLSTTGPEGGEGDRKEEEQEC